MVENGFDLQRGLSKEETERMHYTLKEYKNITNFEKTKEHLQNIKLELPDVPDITDIHMNRLSKKRDEVILDKIIKPKDKLINELYHDNFLMQQALLRNTKLVEKAEKYQKERTEIMSDNRDLHNEVENIKKEYEKKEFDLEWKYKNKINYLEKENIVRNLQIKNNKIAIYTRLLIDFTKLLINSWNGFVISLILETQKNWLKNLKMIHIH